MHICIASSSHWSHKPVDIALPSALLGASFHGLRCAFGVVGPAVQASDMLKCHVLPAALADHILLFGSASPSVVFWVSFMGAETAPGGAMPAVQVSDRLKCHVLPSEGTGRIATLAAPCQV